MIKLRILLLEDNPADAGLNERVLQKAGLAFVAMRVDSELAFKQSLADFKPDIVLSDYNLPSYNGRAALEYIHENYPDLPMIMVTGAIGEEMAVELVRSGARDYILKDRLTRLPTAILRVIDEQKEINARRESEKKLREAESKFRMLFETANDGIFLQGATGIVDCNQKAASMYGLLKADVIGRTTAELSPDRQADGRLSSEVIAEKAQAAIAGESQHFEWRALRADNTTFDVDISLNRIELDGVVYLQSIVRDITDRKRAEEKLIEREREFRTLAENIPDNIVRYDLHACRTFLNTSMARTLGIGLAELMNTATSESGSSVGVVGKDEYNKKVAKVLESGESDELEITVHHAVDGMQTHNIRFVPEKDAQGGTIGVLVIGRDITAQKADKEALQEREQRYREIFDNASDGLYLLEVTENGRFRNLDVNPTFEKSTGMRRDDLIGKYVDDTVPPETAQPVIQKYRRCIEVGTAIEEEIELDLPAGRRYYHSTLVPITKAGRIYRLVGISRDVTKLKQTEHDLKESRAQLRGLTAHREEVREEERKHIAREVHDELGQILTGLKLNISVIEHKFSAESSSLRQHLQETLMLTDRSLEVARNVASALRPAVLDLGIVSALEWLAGRFESTTGIQCEMIISETEIQLDENLEIALFRIVQESLTNVARHAKADRVVINLGKDADDYVLKVRDNGVGFDTNARKMNSFGLVGIRERVLMLGGTIAINSRPGNGTEITVRIPTQSISEES